MKCFKADWPTIDMQKEKPRAPTERQVKYVNDLLGKAVRDRRI